MFTSKLRIIVNFLIVFTLSIRNGFAQTGTKNITEYILSNGIKLIIKVDRRAPVVMNQIWYKVGSGNETLGITGISHMLEHMMFRGTKKFPPGELKKIIVENGGLINAETTNDYTMYHEEMTAEKLPLIFELEADRMQGLLLEPNAFKTEKKVVLEERNMRIEDDPQARTEERFLAAAFISSSYHNMTIGWKHDIENLTYEDLQTWYKNWYRPDNAIIVVVGDVNPAQVYNLANQYFGKIPATAFSSSSIKPQKEIESFGERNIVVNLPAKLPCLLLGYNVPSLKTAVDKKDAYALEVLSAILAESDYSRLVKKLVRGKELATNISAGYSLYSRLDNLLTILATPNSPHTPDEIKAAILAEILQLKTFMVPEAELQRVKTQIIANKIYLQDDLSYQAEEIGMLEAVGLPWTERTAYEKNIQDVTATQIRNVARKYLVNNKLTVAVLKPIKLE